MGIIRDSFVVFKNWGESIKALPEEYQLETYRALFDYGTTGIIPDNLSAVARAIITSFSVAMENNRARYNASVENGKLGGAPKGNQNARKQPKNNLEQPRTSENNQNNLENNSVDFENNLKTTYAEKGVEKNNLAKTTPQKNNLDNIVKNNSETLTILNIKKQPKNNLEQPRTSENNLYDNVYVNDNLKVSKKVSNKEREDNNITHTRMSYDELLKEFGVKNQEYKDALFRFIAHLKNSFGLFMLNNRLENLIVKLDRVYGRDDIEKAKVIDDAISKGYKRLECEE